MASIVSLNQSTCLHYSSRMPLKLTSPSLKINKFLIVTQGWSHQFNMLSSKPKGLTYGKTSNILCAMNMNAAQPDEDGKSNLDLVLDKARKLWDSSPQEVKIFPWTTALENFTQLIIDIILVVTQYLYVPVMAITSVSEMSYSAHERKLRIIPLPLLIGVAVAGVLRDRALKLSPFLKDAKVPWHLYANMLFFTLIKLPGPYYPYWGRILIPHFANGGLFRTLWFLFLWYRMPRKDVHADLGNKA
ncbi:hypothetical protein OSB04_030524 [Centaurea solstitialis]|uniref:Uncharacterized protein n=1 Tax=Centaurea solstitialis TaxID=347529 RepID=A0AA38SK09_9ASTR|nr:hypothetical protein OSB04_030524 [Centaurea solstitialis]